MKLQEALNTNVYIVEPNNVYKDVTYDFPNGKTITRKQPLLIDCDIKEVNLYEFICGSIDETTSPRGVAPRMHIRVNGYCDWCVESEGLIKVGGNIEEEKDCEIELWTWGTSGNYPAFVQSFETIEEAEEENFRLLYEYDFLTDDQRSTWYTQDYEEAEIEASEIMEISVECFRSYNKHKALANQIKAERTEKARIEREKQGEDLKTKIREEANKIVVDEQFKQDVKKVYDELQVGENKSKGLSVAFNGLLSRNNIVKITTDYWQVFRIINAKI